MNALKALTASTTNATPLTDGNIDGAVLLGGTVQRSVAWPRDVNDVSVGGVSSPGTATGSG